MFPQYEQDLESAITARPHPKHVRSAGCAEGWVVRQRKRDGVPERYQDAPGYSQGPSYPMPSRRAYPLPTVETTGGATGVGTLGRHHRSGESIAGGGAPGGRLQRSYSVQESNSQVVAGSGTDFPNGQRSASLDLRAGADVPATEMSPGRTPAAMVEPGTLRRVLLLLLALTLSVGVGFIVVIVTNLKEGVGLHEVAGSVLLLLLLPALWTAHRLRPSNPRPILRVAVALAALVAAAVAGAALATGGLPGMADGIPLVPLGVMLLSTADGIRVTLAVAPRASSIPPPHEPRRP